MASQIKGRVLVVDDEPVLIDVHEAVLEAAGFHVTTAANGRLAIEKASEQSFEVVVTDLFMPEMDGLELLRRLRQIDLDVPVIIVTAAPSMDSAIQAVEYGALRYLLKPVSHDELVSVVQRAVWLRKMADLKRQALSLGGESAKAIGDQAGLEVTFASALDKLYLDYQPIVSWSDRRVFAYEALARTRESKVPNPGVLFDAATRLDRLHDLGHRIRQVAAWPLADTDALLFVNLHTTDLSDERLYDPDSMMAQHAERIVLELTERESLDGVPGVRARVARLRELGFRLALDDLGAGYAGLAAFSQLEPDVLKLDLSIVRNVHKSPMKQALIRSMTVLCRDLAVDLVAEGVETVEERDTLLELGCDLLQGFLFARPGAPFPEVDWS